MEHCKGCSHPMICDKHGCAVEEAKENDRRAQAASIAIEQTSRDRADAERFRWLEEHTVATGLSRWMGREPFLAVAVDKAMARAFCAAFPGSAAGMIDVLAGRVDARDAEIARLRTALRFYARGEHYHLDEDEDFDTVSGEPQNWLCSGRDDSATMIENGRVALFALQGIDSDWLDGDEDNTPKPVEGEVSCVE